MFTLVVNWNNDHPAIGPIVDSIIKKRPWLENGIGGDSMANDVAVIRDNAFRGRIFHFGPRWDPKGRGDGQCENMSGCYDLCTELKFEFRAEARKNAELWAFLSEEAPGESCHLYKNRVNFHAFMSLCALEARDHPEDEGPLDEEESFAKELEAERKKRERLESTYQAGQARLAGQAGLAAVH